MKYRATLFSSAFCLVFVAAFFAGSFVFADQYGLEATADAALLPKESSVPNIIGNVIGAGLSLVTVLFFILMIYAGIRWMLARGDEAKAKEALDTIIAAIIGIVVVLAAYAITNFVFKSVGAQEGSSDSSSDGGTQADAGNQKCVRNINLDTDINKIIESYCFQAASDSASCSAVQFYGGNVCSWLQTGGCAFKDYGTQTYYDLETKCNSLSADTCEETKGGTKFCKLVTLE